MPNPVQVLHQNLQSPLLQQELRFSKQQQPQHIFLETPLQFLHVHQHQSPNTTMFFLHQKSHQLRTH